MTRTKGFTHHYRPEEVMFPRAILCKVETNFALLIRLRCTPWKARSSQARRGCCLFRPMVGAKPGTRFSRSGPGA